MPKKATGPDPRDVYAVPASVMERANQGTLWGAQDWCVVCQEEFDGPTYYEVIFRPRRRSGPPYYSGLSMAACSRECAEKVAQQPPGLGMPLRAEGRPTDPALQRHPWLYAFREVGEYPEDTERSGKWMVFWKPDEIDEGWERIREAVRTGQLGYEAKVATKPLPSKRDGGLYHVVCVYTYDSEDVDDVRRVRAELRRLGVTRKIGYKEDEETRQGHYSGNGRRVSKYWE